MSADLTVEDRLIRIEAILRANLLHESNCPAHTIIKGGEFAGLFQRQTEESCDCWISLDRPETDPNKALGIYHIKDETLLQEAFFRTRYHAKQYLVAAHPELSADIKAPNYWGKSFMLVPVELKPRPESTPNP